MEVTFQLSPKPHNRLIMSNNYFENPQISGVFGPHWCKESLLEALKTSIKNLMFQLSVTFQLSPKPHNRLIMSNNYFENPQISGVFGSHLCKESLLEAFKTSIKNLLFQLSPGNFKMKGYLLKKCNLCCVKT